MVDPVPDHARVFPLVPAWDAIVAVHWANPTAETYPEPNGYELVNFRGDWWVVFGNRWEEKVGLQ